MNNNEHKSITRNVVSVDIGYGFVKAISSTGKRVIFPSTVAQALIRKGVSFGNDNNNALDDIEVEIAGQRYFVGELAIKECDAKPTFETDRKSERTKILLATAIQLVNPTNEPIQLITGLPLDFYMSDRQEFESYLKDMDMDVEWITGIYKSQNLRTQINKVKILPQGAAALMVALTNNEGRFLHPDFMGTGNRIALIDIGFRTTDVIVVEFTNDKGAMNPINRLSLTINDLGMSNLREAVARIYKQKTGKEGSEHTVNQALAGRPVLYNGKKIEDFDTEIEKAKEQIGLDIATRIKNKWREIESEIAGIFLAGGGAITLEKYLQKEFGNRLIVTNESQYANAIGYMRLGKPIVKRELEKEQAIS